MGQEALRVGRVMRSTTGEFTIGTRLLQADVPHFGSFVKVPSSTVGCDVIGLIYDVVIEGDQLAEQLVKADVEYVRDERENRLLVKIHVLVVGHMIDDKLYPYLPPQPPAVLDTIVTCTDDEVTQFTDNLAYFRTVLSAPDARPDELLAASLRHAAAARKSEGREFLVNAGRELARLLAQDSGRLEALLGMIKP